MNLFKKAVLGCLPLLLLIAGCAFNDLRHDLAEQAEYVKISGRVTASGTSAPLVIVLLRESALTPLLIRHKTLPEPGKFIFYAQEGSYRLFVFEDRNRDGHYQPDERVGQSGPFLLARNQPAEITVKLPDKIDRQLITSIDALSQKARVELPEKRQPPGQVIRLDSPLFSDKNVRDGLWQPLAMAKKTPVGIFFLEPWDPARKPVLFVHGVSGSPRNFRTLIENLDKREFQAWAAFYPSGFSLDIIASYMKSELSAIRSGYPFKTISIIAHSMGGLVSRKMINSLVQSEADKMVDCFISISTPWNGHKAAASGIKWAPAIIPMWKDVVPGSKFLAEIVTPPLPPHIPHYLFFSYRGSSKFAGGNSDGVVSIASELRPEIQDAAAMVRGYDETHSSILESEAVFKKVNQILRTHNH
jgi:pimeloyl-ACP methyl ester carboxylesterase